MSVRLIAGSLGGRSIPVPAGARPTEARVRGALFSIWSDLVPGSTFLDLFAGSGAVGWEALSRGAARVFFAEHGKAAVRGLEAVRAKLALADRSTVVAADLPRELGWLPPRFDLAYADPPYAYSDHEKLLTGLAGRLAVAGQIVLEHRALTATPEKVGSLVRCDERRYGDCCLSFYRLMLPSPDVETAH